MVTTYLLKHAGPNCYPEICDEQERYFRERQIPFEIFNWPITEGSGDYNLIKDSPKIDFSRIDPRAIFLNGHGCLHGRTFFFVNRLSEGKIDYFQFDEHSDLSFEDGLSLDCGTHAFKIYELISRVRRMYLVGLTPSLLLDNLGSFMGDEESGPFCLGPSPALDGDKTKLIFAETLEKAEARAIKEARRNKYYDPSQDIGLVRRYGKRFVKETKLNLENENISAYISVDLDVIRNFPTGWRGGLLSTERVIKEIRKIGRNRKVIGADICGLDLSSPPERPLSRERKRKALEDIVRVHEALVEAIHK